MDSARFTVGEHDYVASPLNARQQLLVAKRLGLAFGMLGDLDPGGGSAASVVPLTLAFGNLSDADVNFIVDTCLGVTKRLAANNTPAPMMSGGRMMYEDLTLTELIQIAWRVMEANMGGFFVDLRKQLAARLAEVRSSQRLADGTDYILRPVSRGWVRAESLLDGTLSLEDVAWLNDALDVEAENQRRWAVWHKSHPRG